MRRCVVEWCGLESHKDSGISFHAFPKSNEMFLKWLELTGLPLTTTHKSIHGDVCSRHFDKADYQFEPDLEVMVLKEDALPKRIKFPVCSFLSCSNQNDPDSPFQFFKFPINFNVKKQWVLATKRTGFFPTYDSVVCSAHFTLDDCLKLLSGDTSDRCIPADDSFQPSDIQGPKFKVKISYPSPAARALAQPPAQAPSPTAPSIEFQRNCFHPTSSEANVQESVESVQFEIKSEPNDEDDDMLTEIKSEPIDEDEMLTVTKSEPNDENEDELSKIKSEWDHQDVDILDEIKIEPDDELTAPNHDPLCIMTPDASPEPVSMDDDTAVAPMRTTDEKEFEHSLRRHRQTRALSKSSATCINEFIVVKPQLTPKQRPCLIELALRKKVKNLRSEVRRHDETIKRLKEKIASLKKQITKEKQLGKDLEILSKQKSVK